jgi:hypothetical protein
VRVADPDRERGPADHDGRDALQQAPRAQPVGPLTDAVLATPIPWGYRRRPMLFSALSTLA